MQNLLLEHGADKSQGGFQNVHVAVLEEDLESLESLLESNIDALKIKTSAGKTPLLLAAGEIQRKVEQLVEKCKNYVTLVFIHVLLEFGKIKTMPLILAKRPDGIFQQDGQGQTVAHLAALSGNEDTLVLLQDFTNQTQFKELLATKDHKGRTPLILAVKSQKTYMAKYLLSKFSGYPFSYF